MNIKNYIKKPKDRVYSQKNTNLKLQTIFAKKDSKNTEESRNLFNEIEKFSYATLKPNSSTSQINSLYQEIFYVVNGNGQILTESKKFNIKKDFAFIIPPNTKHRIINNSGKPLELLAITEESPKNFSQKILVRDTNKIPFDKYDSPLHWCHKTKTIFDYKQHNLSKVHYVSLVYIEPKKLPEPHVHFPGHDEVWHALEGNSIMAFKDDLIEQTPGTSILIPDDGKIFHTSINPNNKIAKFFFFMHHMSLDNPILITGSRGTIGNIIIPYLKSKGYQFITELDKDNPDNPANLLQDNLTNYFKEIKTIIHLAANSNPFIDKEEADKNIIIAERIIEACKKSNSIERIINASSINVYPYIDLFCNREKITDKTPLSPNKRFGGGQYGQAKIKSEKLLEDFCKENKINLVNLRLGCVTKNDLLSKQKDGTIEEIDKIIYLKHKDLKKIIGKSLKLKGVQNFVCVSSGKELIDKDIKFPL